MPLQTKDSGMWSSTTDGCWGFFKKPDRHKHGLFFLGARSKMGTEEGNVFGTLGE